MDNNTLAIYIHELRNQCTHLQASVDLFNQAMESKAAPAVLYSGQLVLSAASQIAAVLWPSRARSRSRGEALRKVLALEEKHVLNDRRLTEIMENSDAKLEEWIAKTKGKQIIFDFVGSREELNKVESEDGTVGIDDESIYRAHDPMTNIYYYLGVGYNLVAVSKALSDVAMRVDNVYGQMFPEKIKAEREELEARRKAREEAAKAAENTEQKSA